MMKTQKQINEEYLDGLARKWYKIGTQHKHLSDTQGAWLTALAANRGPNWAPWDGIETARDAFYRGHEDARGLPMSQRVLRRTAKRGI